MSSFQASSRPAKPHKGVAMEGALAHWYAKNTQDTTQFRREAEALTLKVPAAARVLEIAPGPGYLAVELARLGHKVTGLDSSATFVDIAAKTAERARMEIGFVHGDAAHMPFAEAAFDLCVCRAAFKNFSDPNGALAEMHRVLRPGGRALVIDMRSDATNEAIDEEIVAMNLGPTGRLMTRMALRGLRGRAYSRDAFERMIAASPFRRGEIKTTGMGFEIWLARACGW